MSFDLKNKLVLVTGASSGIGKAVALEFARRGARLALVGRNEPALREVNLQIQALGQTAHFFACDLAQVEKIPALLNDIELKFSGRVDVLVNSAGIAVLGLIEDVPLEAYAHNLQINFLAPLALIKAVLPGMRRKKSGQIINILSGAASRGLPGVSAYCVSKFALNALTESLRVELAPFGITVISISPGLADTGFAGRAVVYGRFKANTAQGRGALADDVARAITDASLRGDRSLTLSWRTRLARHLNYWAPGLLDRLLRRQLKKSVAS